MTATVKEDGSAVTVGYNVKGEPYVSREGKVGVISERFYDAESICLEHPGINAALYIAAKLWIHAKPAWTHGGRPGDSWNCEVVSSGLNVIDYKHTALIFLHHLPNTEVFGDEGTPLTKMAFSKSMGNEIAVPTWSMNSYDQLELHYVERWAFVRFVQSAELPDVSSIIEFLDGTASRFGTNEAVLTIKLNQVPLDDREFVKGHRDIAIRRLQNYTRVLEHDPELKREGIVIKDGESLIKIVNHLFVLANQYQHAVRNCIKKRTFSNDFTCYFPTCPDTLIDHVNEGWKQLADEQHISTSVERHMLRVMLYTMRSCFERAQHMKRLNDPTGLFDNHYPAHAHQATLVAFKVAIESLNGF